MSNAGQAELRIHNGIHAGARARLEAGRYVLGTDPQCDFVICDQEVGGEQLEIAVGDGGWSYRPLPGDGNINAEAILIAPGTALRLGPVVISVEQADAPWRTPISQPEPAKRETAQDVSTDERKEPSPAAEPAAVSETPGSSEVPQAQPPRLPPTRRYKVLWATLGICVLIGLLALFLLGRSNDAGVSPPSPEAVSADAVFEARKARVVAILERLNMLDRARVERQANGSLVVDAALIDDAEYEELAAELAQLNPRPGLRVSDENTLIEAVRDALAERAPGVKADYLGSGRFRLSGKVANESERDELLQALTTAFPAVRAFESALLTPPMMAERLVQMLQDNEVTVLGQAWGDETFSVDVNVAPTRLLLLKQTLTRVETEYGQWLKFVVRIQGEGAEKPPLQTASLPFKIQGVVGGETPYIVLPGNEKVVPGGSVGKWRLVEVASDHLVFDGPQRLVVSR